MNVIAVYSRIYGDALAKALKGIAKSPWTVLLPVVILILMGIIMGLVAPLGFGAGMVYALATSALYSGYLYFLAQIVAQQKARVGDVTDSLKAYFWSVVNLSFVIWIADLLISLLMRGAPLGAISIRQFMMLLVMLAAAPEVIYQRGTYGGLDTLSTGFNFLQENWIEWFIPHVVMVAVGFALLVLIAPVARAVPFLFELIAGTLVHIAMAFRGNLFGALDGTSHRQRMFKYRNAASFKE